MWLDSARSYGTCHTSFLACRCSPTVRVRDSPRRGPEHTRVRMVVAHIRRRHRYAHGRKKTDAVQWFEHNSTMIRNVPVAFRTWFTNDVLPAVAKHVVADSSGALART